MKVAPAVNASGQWFSRALAAAALVVTSPLLFIGAVAVWLSDRSPILYRAPRVGLAGVAFTMYKLRTMRNEASGSRITGADDDRIFTAGRWLRRFKVDELPQLLNVARGEMAMVGPRPEDPVIVEHWYTPLMRETFAVRPGVTSPGSVRYYRDTEDQHLAAGGDTERRYAELLLPRKLSLELAYVRRRSAWYDLAILVRTVLALAGRGGRLFARQERREEAEAAPIEAAIRRELAPRLAESGDCR